MIINEVGDDPDISGLGEVGEIGIVEVIEKEDVRIGEELVERGGGFGETVGFGSEEKGVVGQALGEGVEQGEIHSASGETAEVDDGFAKSIPKVEARSEGSGCVVQEKGLTRAGAGPKNAPSKGVGDAFDSGWGPRHNEVVVLVKREFLHRFEKVSWPVDTAGEGWTDCKPWVRTGDGPKIGLLGDRETGSKLDSEEEAIGGTEIFVFVAKGQGATKDDAGGIDLFSFA